MSKLQLPDLAKFRTEVAAIHALLDDANTIHAHAATAYRKVCGLEERPSDFHELREKAQQEVETTRRDVAEVSRLNANAQLLVDHMAGLETLRREIVVAVGDVPVSRSAIMVKLRGLGLERIAVHEAVRRAEITPLSEQPCRRQWGAQLRAALAAEQTTVERDYRAGIAGLVLFTELQVATSATAQALERAAKDSRLEKIIAHSAPR